MHKLFEREDMVENNIADLDGRKKIWTWMKKVHTIHTNYNLYAVFSPGDVNGFLWTKES